MKPLQIGLLVIAGGAGGALVMKWQSTHHRATAQVVATAQTMTLAAPAPVPSLPALEPPVPKPESPTKVVPSWRPPRLTPARQPIRVHHSIKQPFAKPSYNRIPVPDPIHYWHSAFVVPVPNSGCGPVKTVESDATQAIVQLELRFMEAIEALRDWTSAHPSAGEVRLPAQTTSTGLAFWQTGPRDAFGRLQTY